MESKVESLLKSCSKDDAAFQQLKDLFEELQAKRDFAERSTELLERAIQHDYDSIIITEIELDKPGPRIVYVNNGFEEMTGYNREEVIGKTPRILQGEKTDRTVLERLKQSLKEGNSFFGQTVNYKKDGSEFINQWDIHPLTDENGDLTHWVSYQHDISKRKRAEEMLVDLNNEFDQLPEESKRTLVDVDEQANIVTANKSFRELTGYDKNELKKLKVWDLLPKRFNESVKRRFDDFTEADFDDETYKVLLSRKGGEIIQLEIQTRLMNMNNQVIVRADIRNISLQKKIMRKLKKKNQRFMQVFKQRSDFEYAIAFDDEGKPVIKYLSDNYGDLTGLSEDQFEGTSNFSDMIHEEDEHTFMNHILNVKSGSSHTEEFRLKTRDGSYIPVMDYAKPILDPDDNEVMEIKGVVSVDKKVTVPQ